MCSKPGWILTGRARASFPHAFRQAPTLILVSVPRQRLLWLEHAAQWGGPQGHYWLRNTFRCSSSRVGTGELEGSNRTPTGWHRIARNIGTGQPTGTSFKGRMPVGTTWNGAPGVILDRILWLDGLEPGHNQGGNHDTFSRYVYIHGTTEKLEIGHPASIGCIHLETGPMFRLFNRVPVNTPVHITTHHEPGSDLRPSVLPLTLPLAGRLMTHAT